MCGSLDLGVTGRTPRVSSLEPELGLQLIPVDQPLDIRHFTFVVVDCSRNGERSCVRGSLPQRRFRKELSKHIRERRVSRRGVNL